MKNFFMALLHAAVGGAAVGVAGQSLGASWKAIGITAALSAITSVLSFLIGQKAVPQSATASK